MSIVLDASLTLARFHAEETTGEIVRVYDTVQQQGGWVPLLWRIEVANVLQRNVRKGKYQPSFRDQTLEDLAELNVQIDNDSPNYLWTITIDLAHRHRLSIYDAIYLELALRLKLPLATLDTDLRTAASREGVPLLGL